MEAIHIGQISVSRFCVPVGRFPHHTSESTLPVDAPGVYLHFREGNPDSQLCHLFLPVRQTAGSSDARACVKIFELDASLLRLKSEVKNLGWSLAQWTFSLCTGRGRTKTPGSFGINKEISMRSDLVFGALNHVANRYQLCQLASKATRKLHKPNTRLQDTTNEVLYRFHSTNPGTVGSVAAPAAQPVERRRAA